MATLTITHAPTPTIAAQPIDWQAITAAFIEQLDVKASSRATYTRNMANFFGWLGATGRSIDTLQRTDLLEYKAELLASGLSTLTVSSYIVTVRAFYKWAEANRYYPNIAANIKTPRRTQQHKKQHLTDTKAAALLATATNKRDMAILNLMLRTGLRTIEVTRLDVGDITYKGDRRVLRIWGKGHDTKDTYVVLTGLAYQPIADYLATDRKGAKAGEPLFTSTSNNSKGGRLTTRTVSGLCKAGLKAIGLDGHEFTAHSLRHTTAVAILKAGGNIEAVATVLRHRQITTSQIYVESVKEELRLQNSPEELLNQSFVA